MVPKVLRTTITAVLMLAAWNLATDGSQSAMAIGPNDRGVEPFANYYVPPGSDGGVAAQMYPCPRPTPPLVGHTYITYPPLMPHEFLYKHDRTYLRHNPGAGWTKTKVCWF